MSKMCIADKQNAENDNHMWAIILEKLSSVIGI